MRSGPWRQVGSVLLMATSPACQSTPAKVRPLAGAHKRTGVPPHRASTGCREEGQQNGLQISEGIELRSDMRAKKGWGRGGLAQGLGI